MGFGKNPPPLNQQPKKSKQFIKNFLPTHSAIRKFQGSCTSCSMSCSNMSCSTLRNPHLPRHSEFEHSIVTSDLGPTTLFTTLEPQHFAAIWGFREMDHSSRSFGTRNSAIFFLFFSIAFGIETCQVRMVGLALHVESGVMTICLFLMGWMDDMGFEISIQP